jgi:hypothetical protein
MTTKLAIVQKALGKIGLASYVFDPSPEQLQAALEQLELLATEMDGIGIRKGYSLGTDISAESGLPDTAVNPFAILLAVELAPDYGKQIAPSLQASVLRARNALMVTNNVIPRMVYPGTLPIGTGNRQDVRQRAYFQDCDPLTTGVDGELQI